MDDRVLAISTRVSRAVPMQNKNNIISAETGNFYICDFTCGLPASNES